MANAAQVRSSVNVWLQGLLPLDVTLAGDRVAFQEAQEQQANEWRLWWDSERDGRMDQAWSRLVQIDRQRGDGDEVALEDELAAALEAIGLTRPGSVVLCPLADYPDAPATTIGYASVRRLRGAGWRQIPDPAGRPLQLRATITLQIEYSA